MHVVVIGGGAAGFFASIAIRECNPVVRITLLEKSDKVLSKVRISGGGRCNVTHACPEPNKLVHHYPRGGKALRKAFALFGPKETIAWFKREGVELKTEADGRMFPVSDDSASVVDALLLAAERARVELRLHAAVRSIHPPSLAHQGFLLTLADGSEMHADRVVITTGGNAKPTAYDWLAALGQDIISPVPSLFTFNMPDEPIRALMGVVVDPVRVRLVGAGLESTGPLLITHWGMSGPAILKLSAWGARFAHDAGYSFTIQVNWLGGMNEQVVRERLITNAEDLSRKNAINADPFHLPKRHWAFLLEKAAIPPDMPWGQLPHRDRNRLIDLLTNDRYQVSGKATFKEEFVTAGGVDLAQVDHLTFESKVIPGLYFAGEVLDIDGVTGGFNFQAAWTTGALAGRAAATDRDQRTKRTDRTP